MTVHAHVASRAVRASAIIAAGVMEWSGPVTAQEKDPGGLKGLKSIILQVRADGGLERSLVPGAEAKLRAAGFDVVTEAGSRSDHGNGLLLLRVTMQCERGDESCGYSVTLRLSQHVHLTRLPEATLTAITWQDAYTTSVRNTPAPTLKDIVAVDAGSLVLKFISDYRAANGK